MDTPAAASTAHGELGDFVRDAREQVVALLDGLTEEQARRRLVPSLTTLLGLVTHATFVLRLWHEVTLAGHARAALGLPETVDESFVLREEDTVASVVAGFRAACVTADEIAARSAADDVVQHRRLGPVTVRWVQLHLVRELSRHAGHGDVLREQVLAADA
jgi:hypothetical protein